jgi:NodT family efflux transporter outer membrane factor (OMF) lipoprotein
MAYLPKTTIAAGYDQSLPMARPRTRVRFASPCRIGKLLAKALELTIAPLLWRSRLTTKSVGSSFNSPSNSNRTARVIAAGERNRRPDCWAPARVDRNWSVSEVDLIRKPTRTAGTFDRRRRGPAKMRHMSKLSSPAQAIVLTTMLVAAGCMVGPDFHQPAAPAVSTYSPKPLPDQTDSADARAGVAQTFTVGEDIPAEWWTLFRSPKLNQLIEEAFAKNPSLDAAQAALRVAAENVSAAEGYLYPHLDASVSGLRQRRLYYRRGVPTGISAPFNLFNSNVSVTYTLDVFGGIRREVEAYRAEENYQRAQLEATYLALTTNVVTAAIQQASLRGQIAATVKLANDERVQLDIVRNEFALGGASEADVLAQQTLLAQTEATLPPLRKQLEIERDLLRVLTGHYPSEDIGENFDLESIHLPEKLPVSLPSTLVKQRPDVRAYEALVHQANAEIGVATANMLPQFTIGGSLGEYASAGVDPAILAFNIGGGIAQPIFQGGTLLHLRRAAIASYNQVLAEYRYTVLVAFQNVADALHALEEDAATLRAYALAESSAAHSLQVARDQYEGGYIPYLTLLSAQNSYQQILLALIQAEAMRYADTAALFQALGGGWWNRSDVKPLDSPLTIPRETDK